MSTRTRERATGPSRCSARLDGSWKSLKSYKTHGSRETRTINLPKGTYRVVVRAKYGFAETPSAPVYLKR